MFRKNYQSVAQDHQRELTIEAWKWLFLLLKPKWYLIIKLEAFYQFPSNGNRKQWVLFYLESFLLISGVSGFSFFAIEHIRKPGNHGKFSEAHFSRYEDYLISRGFLTILCVQEKLSKCCSRSSKRTYHWGLKVAFLVIKTKMVLNYKIRSFLPVS